MTEIERKLYGKCRTAFESSCGAEFRLYSDEKFSAEAIKILKSKDFSFSLKEPAILFFSNSFPKRILCLPLFHSKNTARGGNRENAQKSG